MSIEVLLQVVSFEGTELTIDNTNFVQFHAPQRTSNTQHVAERATNRAFLEVLFHSCRLPRWDLVQPCDTPEGPFVEGLFHVLGALA